MQGKIFRGYVRTSAMALLLVVLCIRSAVFSVFAADEKVISATVDSENVYLYVKGVSNITSGSVQIGNAICENVAVGSLDTFSTPMRTVILIDNSYSIKTDKRSDIQAILKSVVDGRMEGEEFRIGTFSDSVAWLSDYTTDYAALQGILDALEYVNQSTYFSDCLYSVIEEMRDSQDPTYERIIIVSDGADDRAIGYTNQEVSDLLGKRGIPVYTIGTAGDNSALETMFSFSRASKAEYFLLDGTVSNEDIVASLLADHRMFCIRITPEYAMLDGSQKSIRAALQTSEGEVVVTASVVMPFASGVPAVETTPEPQEESTPELADEATPAPAETLAPASNLPVLGGHNATAEADVEKEEGSLADSPMIFFGIGSGIIFFFIIMIVIMFIAAGRKNARRKAEVNKAAQNTAMQRLQGVADTGNPVQDQGGMETDKTLIMGGEAKGGNTISLWDQATAEQTVNTYLVLRDNARPASMFKVPIRNVIRIGRKDADIVIDYDKYISSRQCEIIKRSSLLYIKDLGSANGTYYENARVYDQEIPIVSGGTIQIGQSKFTITIIME